ncbi:LysR family transcriptional regulator, partial [Klebsiella pneumoniae]
MDLRRFITFKTVVEEGSFLRAAQKLCCTQSTVTFHIQQLEQELPPPFPPQGRLPDRALQVG